MRAQRLHALLGGDSTTAEQINQFSGRLSCRALELFLLLFPADCQLVNNRHTEDDHQE